MERNNPRHQPELGANKLESNFPEKGLVVLVHKLIMSQQSVLVTRKVNSLLCCIGKSGPSKLREGIPPPFMALVRPHVKYCVQFWSPCCKRVMKIVQLKADKMLKGLEHLCYEKRLRDVGLFSLKRGRLRGILLKCVSN